MNNKIKKLSKTVERISEEGKKNLKKFTKLDEQIFKLSEQLAAKTAERNAIEQDGARIAKRLNQAQILLSEEIKNSNEAL